MVLYEDYPAKRNVQASSVLVTTKLIFCNNPKFNEKAHWLSDRANLLVVLQKYINPVALLQTQAQVSTCCQRRPQAFLTLFVLFKVLIFMWSYHLSSYSNGICYGL